MTYWFLVGKCVAFALFFGILTWMSARRQNRTATQTTLMWRRVWGTGIMLYAAVVLTIAILIYGDPIPRPTLYVVGAMIVGGGILGFVGAWSHEWIARRIKRLGADPDYGDLDDLTPPPSEGDSSVRMP